MDRLREANEALWDAWAAAHYVSEFYDVEGFKSGRNSLRPIELGLLGDVTGKSLLHLQCHFGMDTLCWARLGATVTGVDFSSKAIALARLLAKEVGLEAKFVRSAIGDLPDNLCGEFDVVFTSYGVLPWLSDLRRWGMIVAHFLKAGGTFLLVDSHPTLCMFANGGETTDWKLSYPYFEGSGPMTDLYEGSYAAPTERPMEAVEWAHSMSEIVNSLIGAGLTLRKLVEYPYCFYKCSPLVVERDDGNWWPIDPNVRLPLTMAIVATKG
jgi:SAM-dependent methyltransferase